MQRHLFRPQKLSPGLEELFTGRIAMPVLGQPVQRVQDTAAEALIPVMLEAELCGDPVSGFEADAPDIIRKTIRILFNDVYA